MEIKLPKLKKIGNNNQPQLPKKEGYIPKNKRKKILLICDDIRVHSGVATVAVKVYSLCCSRISFGPRCLPNRCLI